MLVGLRALTLTVDTRDPDIVELVEKAAAEAGLTIKRLESIESEGA